MTKKGYDRIREELERLKREERPKIIAEIAEARSHGDLSENAEYAAAKEKQGFIEGRIRELETKLADAQVIETQNISTEKVVFGMTVVLMEIDSEERRKYTLVGQDEANLKDGKISVQSPVGRALIGHRVGESVKVITPSKTVEYEILEILFEA
jgi:transcription elongation factor GreA